MHTKTGSELWPSPNELNVGKESWPQFITDILDNFPIIEFQIDRLIESHIKYVCIRCQVGYGLPMAVL